MKILAQDGIESLINELLEWKEEIGKNEISVLVDGVIFSGQLVERSNQFLVLRQAQEIKVASGPNAGRKLASFSYVPVAAIRSVSFMKPLE